MPKPIYIVCSEFSAQDSVTGLASHFNVVEQVIVQELGKQPGADFVAVRALNLSISALWAQTEEDDPSSEYEFRVTFYAPPDGNEVTVGKGTVKFDKPRYRVNSMLVGLLITGTGTFRAEVGIRRAGDDQAPWIVQSYEFPVTYLKAETVDQAADH
jgi:hypothetical protein